MKVSLKGLALGPFKDNVLPHLFPAKGLKRFLTAEMRRRFLSLHFYSFEKGRTRVNEKVKLIGLENRLDESIQITH